LELATFIINQLIHYH